MDNIGIITLVSKNKKIEFPFFKYKNALISNKINQTMLDTLKGNLEQQIKKDDIKTTIEKASEELDAISFESTYSKNSVSVTLIFEASKGAYPVSWREYLNFSLTTGQLLSTKKMFSNQMEFRKQFKLKEKIYVRNYIKELQSPENDTENVSDAIRDMKEGCFQYAERKFKISKDTFYFYPDDCMPHYMQNLNPYEPIKFSKEELKKILKKEFQ